jgi:hypothetical protein
MNDLYQQTLLHSSQSPKRIAGYIPLNQSSKIKQVIDDIYQKEKKYVKHYARDDFI